jgi:hypothetical protein
MLNTAGRQLFQTKADAVVDEMAAQGGPWAAPLRSDATEITEPGSGLLRKQVRIDDDHRLHGQWRATRADDSTFVRYIGLALTPDGEFKLYLLVGATGAWVFHGDTISLDGQLAVTVE